MFSSSHRPQFQRPRSTVAFPSTSLTNSRVLNEKNHLKIFSTLIFISYHSEKIGGVVSCIDEGAGGDELSSRRLGNLVKRGEYHALKHSLDRLQATTTSYRSNPKLFLDRPNAEGNTMLVMATRGGWYQIVELLLERGASVDVMCENGTALHEALIAKKSYALIELLIRHNASPFIENSKYLTPMDLAFQARDKRVIRLIEEKAIWSGWLEQKVTKLGGLATEWQRRWVVIAQRLRYPNPQQRTDVLVRVLLFAYRDLDACVPLCRCYIDRARVLDASDATSLMRTGNTRPSQMELRLHPRHPPVTGAHVTRSRENEIVLSFRPAGTTRDACTQLQLWSQQVQWASQLGVGTLVSPNEHGAWHPAHIPPPIGANSGMQQSSTAPLAPVNRTPVHMTQTLVHPTTTPVHPTTTPVHPTTTPVHPTTTPVHTIHASIESDREIARQLQEEETRSYVSSAYTSLSEDYGTRISAPSFASGRMGEAGQMQNATPTSRPSAQVTPGTVTGSASSFTATSQQERPIRNNNTTTNDSLTGSLVSEDSDGRRECVLCQENKVEYAIVHNDNRACGVACSECHEMLRGLTDCPICRGSIVTIVKIYGFG